MTDSPKKPRLPVPAGLCAVCQLKAVKEGLEEVLCEHYYSGALLMRSSNVPFWIIYSPMGAELFEIVKKATPRVFDVTLPPAEPKPND